jgi:hypothetical protein
MKLIILLFTSISLLHCGDSAVFFYKQKDKNSSKEEIKVIFADKYLTPIQGAYEFSKKPKEYTKEFLDTFKKPIQNDFSFQKEFEEKIKKDNLNKTKGN